MADIERNERALAEWSRDHGRKYFRYPYLHEGDVLGKRDAVRQWLAAHGYTLAQVTVNFADWTWNDAYARCVSRDDRVAIAHLNTTFMDTAMAQLDWSRRDARDGRLSPAGDYHEKLQGKGDELQVLKVRIPLDLFRVAADR